MIFVYAWLLWCALNVMLLLILPIIVRNPRSACTNGIVILIPDRMRKALTNDEMNAVIAHERGHIRNGHALIKLVMICLFVSTPEWLRNRWELQADKYAAENGHADALVSARMKIRQANG